MLVVEAGVLVLRERLVLVQSGLLSPGSLVLLVLVKVLLLFRGVVRHCGRQAGE